MKKLLPVLILVVWSFVGLQACAAIQKVQGWIADPPMAMNAPADAIVKPNGGIRVYSTVEPKIILQTGDGEKFRITVWKGDYVFTSQVYCEDGLPVSGQKSCWQTYYGIKVDGTEYRERQAAGEAKPVPLVFTHSEQVAARRIPIDAVCNVYNMAGC